jgi:hypothetical protein
VSDEAPTTASEPMLPEFQARFDVLVATAQELAAQARAMTAQLQVLRLACETLQELNKLEMVRRRLAALPSTGIVN